MHAKAFLRIFAPLTLALALAGSCGSDSHEADDDDDDSEETTAKKDAGKNSKKDAGSKTSSSEDEAEAEDEDEDEADDEESSGEEEEGDEGEEGEETETPMCTDHSDCPAGEDGGIGCCDRPNGVCFVSNRRACPAVVGGTGTSRPSYN